jgi:negative regulator of flagellin synthesis FlgM
MRVIGSYTRDTSIDTTSALQQQAAAKAGKGHHAKGAPPPPSSTAGAVTVSLSQKAQELASSQATSASSDVDTAKVDRLKSAIASGSFQVDSSKIASKIVDED